MINISYKYNIAILIFISICLHSCKNETVKEDALDKRDYQFELKSNKETGIDFTNNLSFNKDFNVYKYRNYYNGGGVALGDINNDGLIDVYMVSNQQSNKLFINKGNWKFEDITSKSNVGGTKAWSTGVSMVDINADGWLDIYVCNSGDIHGDNKENELFINNGDLTFTEKAKDYGLNDKGYSTHASFFDYDKDGDLDCYVLNNSFRAIGSFDLRKNQRNQRDELGGDKLYKNNNGKFVDVSAAAGIYGSEIGFGLGITVGDVNNDGWEDIFISNDFFERDYLYINQKNGSFKEELENQMQAISAASMGADIADINNDGWNDIFVTDMLPSDYQRLKTVTTFDDWNRYSAGVKNGYFHQFTRNMLHLNNGNNTFCEISRMVGVEASDWSWGALFFDMENDGNKDLFIANGIYQDLTNQDYLQYIANESVMKSIITNEGVDYKKLIEIIPSNPIENQAYKNNGNLNFQKNKTSGLWTSGFSNGAAYGDLDNDGDFDLVVNNLNMPCFVYENKIKSKDNKFIKLILEGEKQNKFAIGASILVSSGSNKYLYEVQPIRGFQSSMDPRPNIGVGNAKEVDVKITWPSGKITEMKKLQTNQTLSLKESGASKIDLATLKDNNSSIRLHEIKGFINYTHQENDYNDFNRENLLYNMMSCQGPRVACGDVNGDQLNDLVIPGAKGIASQIFIQLKNGKFVTKVQPNFETIKESEHVAADLFDADGDGDLDVYLASGGVEISEYSEYLFDELMLNDGQGNFSSSKQRLPKLGSNISTGAVCHGDIDHDGDMDLFVGERGKIGKYGAKCSGYILKNNGKGIYTDVTSQINPLLTNIGMITDARFEDLDGDAKLDLVIVGEYMNISIFKNTGQKFEKVKVPQNLEGWWNCVYLVDIDNDGDKDIIVGNHGLNSRFKASIKNPIRMYYNDYDQNGFPEAIITQKNDDGKYYPYHLRHTLVSRLPGLKKKFPDFKSFMKSSIDNIFSNELLEQSEKNEIYELRSMILVNDGSMNFTKKELPQSIQISPVYAISKADIDHDGDQDLIMGGNLYNVQPEMGRYDASYGHILINDGKGNFTDNSKENNFSVKGEIRSFIIDKNKLFIFRNREKALEYEW